MTKEQIKYMVDRFLGWRLPENFNPDAGISFKPTFNDHMPTPTKHTPTGTNLFDARQAEAMVRYMLDGLPASESNPSKLYAETTTGFTPEKPKEIGGLKIIVSETVAPGTFEIHHGDGRVETFAIKL